MTAFRIVQLHPAALAVTGDRGNALVLRRRLELAGFEAEVVEVDGATPLPADADLVVIGNGPFSAVEAVLPWLRASGPRLREWIEDDVPVHAVGAGIEVLGSEIRHTDGTGLAGLGLLPVHVDHAGERRVGYVGVRAAPGDLVAFEDWRGTTTLEAGGSPFGEVTRGVTGTRGSGDGVRYRNVIGTRLQGPVLPLNPTFADWLIGLAAERRGAAYAPGEAHAELDRRAAEARAVILKNIDHPFTHI